MSYALQYLFGRAGIDAEPLLSWQTYLSSDKAAELLGYCCEPVRKMRIGGDIERFARKAEFSDEYIYLLEGNGSGRCRSPFSAATVNFGRKSAPVSIFRSIRSSPSGATIRRRRMSAYTG